jgi:hypothetical protein
MEKHSAAHAAEATKASIIWLRGASRGILIPEGLSHLLFSVPALWNAKPIPLGSAKSKKTRSSAFSAPLR